MSRIIASNTSQLRLVLSDPGAYLRPKHLVRFVDRVVEQFDLSRILNEYDFDEKRGRSMFDPVVKTKLVIYGYCTGVISEHGIEDAIKERFDFNFLAGGRCLDSTTIGKFKKRHLPELAALSNQVLKMAAGAGLIDLKVTALDGTKILADASRHKAMSIDRLKTTYPKLKKEIAAIKRKLRRLSQKSPARQKELLNDLAFKTKRFETVKQAKSDLERRIKEEKQRKAKENAEKKAKERTQRRTEKSAKKDSPKAKNAGKKSKETSATSKNASKPQINFTDKESRIMKMGNGWGQCYNAQAVVDRRQQIIVAQSVTQDCNDTQQWEPNLSAVAANLGLMPDICLGDTGYFSETNVTAPALAMTKALIPPRKQRMQMPAKKAKPVGRVPKSLSVADKMRRTLQTKEGKKLYAMRKGTVEPVFGQIKSCKQAFRQFSFRGLKKVELEWQLVCLGHNLVKIYNAWESPDRSQPAA